MDRRIEAVVLNYNDHEATLRAVAELEASRGVEVDVLVVDAASRADDVAALRRGLPLDRRLLLLPENRGYAGGMNAGLEFWREEGRHGSVLLVTPDARVDPGAAGRLLEALDADEGVGAVGPVVVYSEEPGGRIGAGGEIVRWTAGIRLIDEVRGPKPYDVDWIEGCCMLLRPAAVEAVGGFDEDYFLYFEEIDLCHRLRQAGWAVRAVPGATVLHLKGPGAPPRYFYYMTRNAYRFWRRNFGMGPWRPALRSLGATAWLGLVALGSVAVPTRWPEVPARLRDFRHQLAGAWAGTVDHLRGRTGARAPRRPRG